MAVRQITSDPKPSTRLNGFWYAYYNKSTPEGGECVAVFSPAIRDIVKKGFTFDDSIVTYDENLRASVLALDFDESQAMEEPQLPPCPETGWADPDCLPPASSGSVSPPRAGLRPQAARRRAAAQLDPELSKLPAPLLKMGIEITRLFLVIDSQLKPAIGDSNRAYIAQKLAVSAAIPYYRSVGVSLSEDEAQTLMTI